MPLPTTQQLSAGHELYERMLGWKSAYEVIRAYCRKHPSNNNGFVVFNKVALINKFYSTQIKAERHLAIEIAQQASSLNHLLGRGDAQAIEMVALCGKKKVFVFSTKFAHFHEPEKFSICDSKAFRALVSHGMDPGKDANLKIRYTQFRDKVRQIIRARPSLNFHKIDQYLWLKGMKLEGKFTPEIRWAKSHYPKLWAKI